MNQCFNESELTVRQGCSESRSLGHFPTDRGVGLSFFGVKGSRGQRLLRMELHQRLL